MSILNVSLPPSLSSPCVPLCLTLCFFAYSFLCGSLHVPLCFSLSLFCVPLLLCPPPRLSLSPFLCPPLCVFSSLHDCHSVHVFCISVSLSLCTILCIPVCVSPSLHVCQCILVSLSLCLCMFSPCVPLGVFIFLHITLNVSLCVQLHVPLFARY